jgi:hypothetical protein
MLEQRLINAFMKLTARIGAGELIREMIQQVDENGNPKAWTPQEMERAIHFIEMHVENFGSAEATAIILTLMKKFEITANDLHSIDESQATPGIPGLQ